MANQVQTDPPSRRGAAHGGTLILGGGFAGAHIARCLGKRGATIISPESAMLYAPILPEVAAGAIEARHVTVPLRVMCPHAEVLLGWATALDEDTRIVTVETEGGEIEVSYDNLVVALGAVASWLPIPGLAQHALGFKNLADAIHLREHVLHQLDTAATDPGHAARHLAFVFVGAGYAGVEALAEVRDLVRDALRHHPALRDIPQRWVLVDLAPRILPEAPGGLGDYAAKQLRKRGAELRLSTTVTSVEEHAVDLSDGTRIETNTWCGPPASSRAALSPALASRSISGDGSSSIRCCESRGVATSGPSATALRSQIRPRPIASTHRPASTHFARRATWPRTFARNRRRTATDRSDRARRWDATRGSRTSSVA